MLQTQHAHHISAHADAGIHYRGDALLRHDGRELEGARIESGIIGIDGALLLQGLKVRGIFQDAIFLSALVALVRLAKHIYAVQSGARFIEDPHADVFDLEGACRGFGDGAQGRRQVTALDGLELRKLDQHLVLLAQAALALPQTFFCPLAFGDILHRTFEAHQMTMLIANAAPAFGYPDYLAIFAVDLRFKSVHQTACFHLANKFAAPFGLSIIALAALAGLHQLFRRAVA